MEAQQKVVQYLNEAHATELALTRTLQAHIAVTPRGSYRTGLEKHLRETQDHAERVQQRIADLDGDRNPVQAGVGAVQSIVAQVLALSKGPIDLVRGLSAEEKLLKNAKDECATEALEISTYDALERLAKGVGDKETAALAADIRADEEKMLANLRKEIPKLTDAVVKAELRGEPQFDPTTTPAGEAARATQETVRETTKKASRRAKSTARQARKVPGVTQAEGEIRGAVASEGDLAIANYDSLSADEIVSKLADLPQVELAKVDAYERKNQNRSTVLERVSNLRGDEPWPGYDDLSVADVKRALSGANDQRVAKVRDYERRHKNRQGIIQATEKELAKS